MKISLPEERALLGKANALDTEPLSLAVDDNQMTADGQKSNRVYLYGETYSNEERDRIIARLHLGL